MNSKNVETGTKGTTGTGGLISSTRAREGEIPFGINEDCDLEYIPDGETVMEGSEPLTPLPTFMQAPGIWPERIQQIVDKDTDPARRDILLLGALTVFGATLGPKVRVMYDNRWLSPCMMCFVVAPPASGKGVLSWLRHIVQPFHDELRNRWRAEMRTYRTEKMKFDYMGKERNKLSADEIPTLPVRKYFIIPGNNTGTGMQANIINSEGRGIIFEPEADTLSTSNNSEYGHMGDALRKTFDHEGISFYRRTGDESREVDQTYLSVLLSGTPAQVLRLIPSIEDGLFSRFMFYYMKPKLAWQNKFKRQEDLNGWFKTLGRQWKKQLDSMKDVSRFTFKLTDSQEDIFNELMSGLLERSVHTEGSEATSIVYRLAIHVLRIMSVVALLRILPSDSQTDLKQCISSDFSQGYFLPDPDVPDENLRDGICPRFLYGIGDMDFNACVLMMSTLFRHAMHVHSLLPAVEVTNRGSADRERLFSKMDDTFTRKDYLEKASELGINENTALQWIKRGLKKGLMVKVGHGVYAFTKTITYDPR